MGVVWGRRLYGNPTIIRKIGIGIRRRFGDEASNAHLHNAMIDLLVKDLDKEMTVAKAEEKDAQGTGVVVSGSTGDT